MRQFLACDLPEPVRRELLETRDSVGPSSGWRWLDVTAVHLTLLFLGDVDGDTDRAARPAWRRTVGRFAPPALRTGALGTFGGRDGRRVLWVGLHDDADVLGPLVRDLETTARKLGFRPRQRPFRPHLTIARSGGRRTTSVPSAPRVSGSTFLPSVVVLYRSDLGRDGARYTALDRFPLEGGGT